MRNKRDPRSSCSLVISLTQALVLRKDAASIGFRVYKLSGDHSREAVLGPAFINNAANLAAKSGTFINYREVGRILFFLFTKFNKVKITFKFILVK